MEQTKIRMAEAIRDGEILTIVYAAGSQPGTKRKISPIRFRDGMVVARCIASGVPKEYALDSIDIVSPDHSASDYLPGIDSPRNRRREPPSVNFIDGYADGWAFLVPEAFRAALDIILSTLIDPEPTETLRSKRRQEMGYASKEDLKARVPDPEKRRELEKEINRYKRLRQTWTEGNPPIYDFHEGDTLHSKDGRYILQVNAPPTDGALNIKVIKRIGEQLEIQPPFSCTQAEFAMLLKDGFKS